MPICARSVLHAAFARSTGEGPSSAATAAAGTARASSATRIDLRIVRPFKGVAPVKTDLLRTGWWVRPRCPDAVVFMARTRGSRRGTFDAYGRVAGGATREMQEHRWGRSAGSGGQRQRGWSGVRADAG